MLLGHYLRVFHGPLVNDPESDRLPGINVCSQDITTNAKQDRV